MNQIIDLLTHCWRCTRQHLHRHRRKYASAAMIYSALFLFGVDFAANIATIPWLHHFLESQSWTVPFATLAGHAGFILERA